MKNTQTVQLRITNSLRTLLAGVVFLLVVIAGNSSFAYRQYNDGCMGCHGAFTDDTSTKGSIFPDDSKHKMHKDTMNTECNLCHTSGDGKDPFIGSSNGTANNPGLGCNGCHNAFGLRAHHAANGITACAGCHPGDGTPLPENVLPHATNTYYGTADTLADNPLNDVALAYTNENWTVGDFVGTDNDGDNLYDMADFDGGHPFIIATSEVIGNDLQIKWASAGGRCEILQQTDSLNSGFSDIGSVVTNSGVGVVTNNVTIVGGATSPTNRFFRVRYTYPAL